LTDQLTLDEIQLKKLSTKTPILMVGDSIEIMKRFPEKSIDLIIDDVGYDDLEKDRAIGTTTRLTEKSGAKWFKLTSYNDTVPIYADILKQGRHIYFWRPAFNRGSFSNWVNLIDVQGLLTRNNFHLRKIIPVLKNYRGMGYSWNARHEMLLYAIKKGSARQLNDLSLRDYFDVKWKHPHAKDRVHTSEKPLQAYKLLFENSSLPNDIVLEPFAGSFQSAVCNVKYKLNRIVIGIEIDMENAQNAAKNFEKICKKKLKVMDLR
jgi:site-specific DNA-methyltransferase (adenine-specific)